MTFYFALAGTLYFFDSVPLALAMLQLNLLEFFIALRIKATRDALARTVQALSAAQLELALLVSTTQTCFQTRAAAVVLWASSGCCCLLFDRRWVSCWRSLGVPTSHAGLQCPRQGALIFEPPASLHHWDAVQSHELVLPCHITGCCTAKTVLCMPWQTSNSW